jgi:hypothetical protein
MGVILPEDMRQLEDGTRWESQNRGRSLSLPTIQLTSQDDLTCYRFLLGTGSVKFSNTEKGRLCFGSFLMP